MQKRAREKRKEEHKKYIKTPKYKAWKKEYDRKHRAKKEYGDFWESHLIIKDIEKDFQPRFKEFYTSKELRTCDKCSHEMEIDERFV